MFLKDFLVNFVNFHFLGTYIIKSNLILEGGLEVSMKSANFSWYYDDDSDMTREEYLPNGTAEEVNTQVPEDPGHSTGTLKLTNINLDIKQVLC